MLSPASVQKFFAIMEPKPHDKFNKKRDIPGCPAGRLWKNTEDGLLLTQSSLSPGGYSFFFQRIHHEKILQPDMPDRRGGEIHSVIGYNDLAPGIIKPVKQRKFSGIRAFLGNAVCRLYQIFLFALPCQKINFQIVIPEYRQFLSHVYQFIVYDVFQIMGQVISSAHLADRIEGNILVIKLHRIIQIPLCLP